MIGLFSRLKDFTSKHTYVTLLIILLLGLILRLAFFSGMGASDPLWYSKAAYNLDKGIDQDNVATLSTRIGLTYPVYLIYNLFGVNDLTSALFNLVTSMLSIALMFFFGSLLFGARVGLIAAFLFSIFPLEIVYATKLSSDFPAAFFMGLGIFIFLYQELKSRKKAGHWYYLAGFTIGISYLIRESTLLIALFFMSYIIYKKKLEKNHFLVPLGVLTIFLLEAFIFFQLTGDPLYRNHQSEIALNEANAKHDFYGRLDLPSGLLHYLWLFLTDSTLSFFYAFIFIAIIYTLFFRKRESNLLLLWLIPVLLYLSFGSTSFFEYAPFRAVDRYTSIINMPAILLLAFFLSDKATAIKKAVLPATFIFLLISSIAVMQLREDRDALKLLRESKPAIDDLGKQSYIDRRSNIALDYLASYQGNENLGQYPDSLAAVHDAYVIINHVMIQKLREAGDQDVFPKEIDDIPRSWKLTRTINSGSETIDIYYVP